MLPTVDEFTLYHSSRRAELEVIGKQQLVSRVHSEIHGGGSGVKAKKVGNSADVPRPEHPMVGARKLLTGGQEEVGLLELVLGGP